MASLRISPLQQNQLSSITLCKYPSAPNLKLHSPSLLFSISTLRHKLSIVKANANKVSSIRQNTHTDRAIDSTIHREIGELFSSLRSTDERVNRTYKKPNAEQSVEKTKFRRHNHERKNVDSISQSGVSDGFFSLTSRDERLGRKSKKAKVSQVVDEHIEKKFGEHKLGTKSMDSRISTELDDGFSSMRPRDERVDRKSKKTMGSVMVDGKIEKKIRENTHTEKSDKFSSTRSVGGKVDRKSKKTQINPVGKKSKKSKVNSGEVKLRVGLDMCSKRGDVMGAISLYDLAVRDGMKFGQYHYNVLLYLCSSAAVGIIHPAKSGSSSTSRWSSDKMDSDSEFSNGNSVYSDEHGDMGKGSYLNHDTIELNSDLSDAFTVEIGQENSLNATDGGENNVDYGIRVSDDVKQYALTRGFEIYEKMCLEKIPLSEAALTSIARMAMSMGNGDMAFEMVKQMKALGINPRLRSYGPALFTFCNNGNIEKAFEVEKHMLESGVYPEEPELEALLRLSIGAGRGEKVYYLLHKFRTSVRQVSLSTADLIEKWFESAAATRVGKRKWDGKLLSEAMENGGGGWHGLGWLGKGKWTVTRTTVGDNGVCESCGEKLATIDIDPLETENFANSVAAIAGKRERNSSFQNFQKWLDYYGPFEAVVDAANVGLFSQRRFLVSKVNTVVNGIRQKLPSKKWPLIVVHNKRITGGKMEEPANKKLIEKWKNADALYATPTGSNDDWYWLYAAIKFKCLIVTNDEMRDHIFQILGNDFFPKWKERHQVHFSFYEGSPEFHLPPPCSVVIQKHILQIRWKMKVQMHKPGIR
ncbi:proteinaceous RNase P 1, chloroplastic/mitochondrial-like isoform X2 [Tasmannia lanceolata]|uniref:proteinaceous RNase P 1, chloroplastic/mitochondrial-like isoform X2 n=1 Tax=Tasmannia lanceolata TaxID=3420 RepID=UPI004064B585